ncbi:Tyrosine-protein phosphatase non-receptor type 9 [Hondaea fermentalgiana]|uniref:Tyrosine-protein phosphatase non-receptor type 9 n=1 Tax=Hondaea fermentalgiana TaxID=2315210 RepID=A0A2R5G231_9STRA|nr:Tyrosine-protein phosphatase non-receptor type 9 [Hondaea fermentalgiana]|eukprot:GBG23788.1 Tyrosine-protein phosphatase non-receptor type 9 [Hondaea fermentalgiana]
METEVHEHEREEAKAGGEAKAAAREGLKRKELAEVDAQRIAGGNNQHEERGKEDDEDKVAIAVVPDGEKDGLNDDDHENDEDGAGLADETLAQRKDTPYAPLEHGNYTDLSSTIAPNAQEDRLTEDRTGATDNADAQSEEPRPKDETANNQVEDDVIDDEAIAMILAQEETDPQATLSREESARRRAKAALQDEAELRLIRALLEAEQSKDFDKINSTQGLILSSDVYEDSDGEEGASNPGNPDDEAWVSGVLTGEEGNDGASPSAAPAQQTESSGWSFRRGFAAAKAKALGVSSRAAPASSEKQDKQGFSEEEMLTVLGTEVEEDYIARFKVMLEQQLGADFFFEHDDIASNLDFWAKACLRARRFRVQRAIDLMGRYAQCKAEIENQIGADKARVRELLTTGVLCFLGGARCREGRGIIVMRMGLHDPRNFTAADLLAAAHETTMHAIRQYPRLQAMGFTIIQDMTGATTRNFDTKVPKLLSRTIESKLPIRYGRVIVVNPPSFFSAVFRVVSFFLSSKMRKRMVYVHYRPTVSDEVDAQAEATATSTEAQDAGEDESNPLENFILRDHLPLFLGGAKDIDYASFAQQLVPEGFDDAYEDEALGGGDLDAVAGQELGNKSLHNDNINEDDAALPRSPRSPGSPGGRSSENVSSPGAVADGSQYVHTAFV